MIWFFHIPHIEFEITMIILLVYIYLRSAPLERTLKCCQKLSEHSCEIEHVTLSHARAKEHNKLPLKQYVFRSCEDLSRFFFLVACKTANWSSGHGIGAAAFSSATCWHRLIATLNDENAKSFACITSTIVDTPSLAGKTVRKWYERKVYHTSIGV